MGLISHPFFLSATPGVLSHRHSRIISVGVGVHFGHWQKVHWGTNQDLEENVQPGMVKWGLLWVKGPLLTSGMIIILIHLFMSYLINCPSNTTQIKQL